MLQPHEKKLIYLTAGVAAVFLLVGLFVIYPQYRGIKKINQQIFSLRTALETKYEKAKRLHKSRITLAAAKNTIANLQPLFVKKGEEIQFITTLEKLADQMAVQQILTLDPIPKQLDQNTSSLDLRITAVGQFQNLMEYLEALEKNQYLFAVSNLAISSKNGAAPLTLSLQAKIYVQN